MRTLIAVALVALATGCDAIDDFSVFHVVDAGVAPTEFGADLGLLVDDSLTDGARDAPASADLATKPDLARAVVPSLARVGAGDFTIAFEVRTVAALDTVQPLLNQRATCNQATSYWTVRMETNGSVSIETGGPSGTAKMRSNSPINDGKVHHVSIARRAAIGGFITSIDASPDAGPLPSPTLLDDLPPLAIGKEAACNLAANGATVSKTVLSVP